VTFEDAIARYQALYGRLRADTTARALAMWQATGGPGDGNVEAFLAVVIPMIVGAQVAAARLVAGYLAVMTRLATGTARPAPIPAAAVTVEALRGVAASEVYTRPVITMRAALAEGKSYEEAFDLATDRVGQLADTDVALAQREATLRVVGADERIVGYRRVLTGRSCAFCATASTQRYHRRQLMPLHTHCDCGVAPIFGTADPGNVINRPFLRDLKTAAKEDGRRDYWAARHVTVDEDGTVNLPKIAVHNHGELGPVLTRAGDHFAGPGGIAA
jgi:hypothetical protein